MDNQDKPFEANVDGNTFESQSSEKKPSQLDLIQQWCLQISCLKKDTGFTSVAAKETDKENNELSAVMEAIEYLDQKNALLDEHDDFLLSDSGFLKYKSKHMLVFDYLSQLPKLVKTKDTASKSKFYLVSRSKHIEQQHKHINWFHSLIHFTFIPAVILLFMAASWWTVKQTQENGLVMLILFGFYSLYFDRTRELLKPFKNTAATPFRFRVSLFGIHSLATLLKVCLCCVIPVIVTMYLKQYWVDDVIIISLAAMCFFHYKPDSDMARQTVSVDSSEKKPSHV